MPIFKKIHKRALRFKVQLSRSIRLGESPTTSPAAELMEKGFTTPKLREIDGLLDKVQDLTFFGQNTGSRKSWSDLQEDSQFDDVWFLSSDLANLPNFVEFVSERDWEVVKDYLGEKAFLKRAHVYHSLPTTNAGLHQYGWHYDIDDHKFLKLFVYLSDVDENCGPHQIFDSSLPSRWFRICNRRVSHEKLVDRYGAGAIRTMLGPQGTAFFEDTFLYHRGTNPLRKRCILQYEFGVSRDF